MDFICQWESSMNLLSTMMKNYLSCMGFHQLMNENSKILNVRDTFIYVVIEKLSMMHTESIYIVCCNQVLKP